MRSYFRENDATAAVVLVAVSLLGLLVRHTLSPDGVAYLDLAAALRRGDLHHFVQGYWSPLYPALLAAIELLSGKSTSNEIAIAHLLNVAAVAVTIFVIWRWTRTMRSPWFTRGAFAALVVCGAEPPRVEALTPDLILLGITVSIGFELMVHRGERWLWLGILFGLAYLTKTGVWPWLIVAMGLRTAMAHAGSERRTTLQSHLVTLALMLCWAVPISVQAGHPTFGSTGVLNAEWYLASSDARTPDTHVGQHSRYRTTLITDSSSIAWAEFDSRPEWTYPPWSSPDSWVRGVITRRYSSPTIGWLLEYWAGTLRLTLTLWLRTLLVFVLIPAIWIGRRTTGATADAACCAPTTLLAMLLGGTGVAEYVLIHAEPRLIAPFALLFALALLDWRVGDRAGATAGEPREIPATIGRRALSLLGLAAAAYVMITRIDHAIMDDRRIASGLLALDEAQRNAFQASPSAGTGLAGALSASVPAHPRVVIVGPALPVMANVFWVGGRIVAQLPPAAAASLAALPPARQRALLGQLFHERADVLWITDADGGFQIVHVP